VCSSDLQKIAPPGAEPPLTAAGDFIRRSLIHSLP